MHVGILVTKRPTPNNRLHSNAAITLWLHVGRRRRGVGEPSRYTEEYAKHSPCHRRPCLAREWRQGNGRPPIPLPPLLCHRRCLGFRRLEVQQKEPYNKSVQATAGGAAV